MHEPNLVSRRQSAEIVTSATTRRTLLQLKTRKALLCHQGKQPETFSASVLLSDEIESCLLSLLELVLELREAGNVVVSS